MVIDDMHGIQRGLSNETEEGIINQSIAPDKMSCPTKSVLWHFVSNLKDIFCRPIFISFGLL